MFFFYNNILVIFLCGKRARWWLKCGIHIWMWVWLLRWGAGCSPVSTSLSLASLLDVAPSCWAWLTLNFLSTRLNIIILSKSFPAEMQSRVNRRTRCSLTKSWTKISKSNYRGSCLPSRCLPGASYCSPVTFLLLGDCFIDWLLEIGTWNPVVLFFFLNIDSNFEFYMKSLGLLGWITSSIL